MTSHATSERAVALLCRRYSLKAEACAETKVNAKNKDDRDQFVEYGWQDSVKSIHYWIEDCGGGIHDIVWYDLNLRQKKCTRCVFALELEN